MRHHLVRSFLHVVRRQAVVGGAHEGVEVAPGLPRDAVQQQAVVRAQTMARRGDRPAQPPGDERRREPERQDGRGRRQRAGPRPGHQEEEQHRGERTRRHLADEEEEAAPYGEAGRAGRGGGRGFPLQEPPLGCDQAHQREDDGVRHFVRVVGQESQQQEHLRAGGLPVFDHQPPEHPERLLRGAAPEEPQDQRVDREGHRAEDERGPHPGGAGKHQPGAGQGDDGGGRHQRAPEVVEDLPAGDDRQPVPFQPLAGGDQREEPEEDLPVAAGPAMLAPRMGEHARGVVVHHFDVGDERGPRVQPLEEVVREHGVLGHPSLEGGHEGVHIVEALAGEDSLAEEVLIGVRDRGRVGIDAGVAGVHPGEERPGRAGQGHAHPRLEDAVALGHPPEVRVEVRAIEGMRDDADELAGGVARQPGVAVQRDAVAHPGQDGSASPSCTWKLVSVAPRSRRLNSSSFPRFRSQPIQAPFARVPLAHPVKQVEAAGRAVAGPRVELGNAAPGRGEDRLVSRHGLGGGVGEIAEDGEVDLGIAVAEGQDLQVLEQVGHALDTGQQRRDDHHGAVLRRARRGGTRAVGVASGGGAWRRAAGPARCQLGRREEEQRRGDELGPEVAARQAGVGGGDDQQGAGGESDGAEVDPGGVGGHEAPGPTHQGGLVGDVEFQVAPARTDQVVAHVRGAVVQGGLLRGQAGALDRAERHPELSVAARLGEFLHRLPVAVAALEIHLAVRGGGVAPEHLLHQAHALEEERPVEAWSRAGGW